MGTTQFPIQSRHRRDLQIQGTREPARKGGTEHREAGAKSIKDLRVPALGGNKRFRGLTPKL